MLRCKVCGCEFDTTVENHYISRDNGKTGLAAGFGVIEEECLYDSFDCPKCGCQIVTQERKRVYIPVAKIDDESEDE